MIPTAKIDGQTKFAPTAAPAPGRHWPLPVFSILRSLGLCLSPSKPCPSSSASSRGSLPYVRLPGPPSAKKTKKAALNLVQSEITLLSSTQFCKNRVEKTRKNVPKSTFSGPFMSKSAAFSALAGTVSSSLLAVPCSPRMRGMHTVWTRYGKGMRPSPNSCAIK